MKQICIWVSILCACFASVAWSQQPAAKGQHNWTEFHRQNMMRWNPYEKVLNVNNVGSLQVKWKYATGSEVNSSPAVANGVVYAGSQNGTFYALSASTGRKRWSYGTGGQVQSSPAVANGVVYFDSFDGNVYALKARHWPQGLELRHGGPCAALARPFGWRCLCRLGRRKLVRARCRHRSPVVELCHG